MRQMDAGTPARIQLSAEARLAAVPESCESLQFESTRMKSFVPKTIVGNLLLAFILSITLAAQDSAPVQENPGQASQPGGVATKTENPAPSNAAGGAANGVASTIVTAASKAATRSSASDTSTDDNPYDPLLEPPPLPKGKPTLIGGIATSVDQVRYRLTVAPFGGGPKVKLFVDERSHIYRNGTETTVLGIHKGDRVYADTMLDGSRVFAKNVRVITEPSIAEVRGQVVATNPEKGTIRVQDQLSARPVTFAVSPGTKYSSIKGTASSGDVQPGSLIDVQFARNRSNRDLAQEIIVLAKPGDDYIFSGTVTHLDMRTSTLALENSTDKETYELHFDPAKMEDAHKLKVGSEVTAHATFDGKQYKASNLRIEKPGAEEGGEQSKAQ